MKKIIIILTTIILILFISPTISLAADEDFDFSYDFYPDQAVPNGEVRLNVTVQNLGTTNITWFDVTLNLEEAYSERITSTITPGNSRTYSLFVTFSQTDLNTEKIIQVSMNNDTDANPDGVKHKNFTVEGIDAPLSLDTAITPAQAYYLPGDIITIDMTVTNNIETHAITDINLHARLLMDGALVAYHFAPEIDTLFPLDSATKSFDYELQYFAIGNFEVLITKEYTVMGTTQTYSQTTDTFIVKNIDFTAELYVEDSSLYQDENAEFSILIDNAGSTVDRFEVRGEEFALMASSEGLAAGAMGEISFEGIYDEDITTSFTVIGYIGEYSESEETNTVTITIFDEPAPTSTPATSPSVSSDSSAESSPDETPSAESLSSSEAISQSPSISPSADAESATSDSIGFPIGVYVLIALLVMVAAAIVVLIFMILKKKSPGTDSSDFS